MDGRELTIGHGGARDLVVFDDAGRAVARIAEIYEGSAAALRERFAAFRADDPGSAPDAPYPYVGLAVGLDDLAIDARLAFGVVLDPGIYGTTLTRPDLFGDYYREQIGLLMERHRVPVVVGRGPRSIPLPFVAEHATAGVTEAEVRALTRSFALPDLASIDDSIANGTYRPAAGVPRPLALFPAERVDYSLQRLAHYTATDAAHFQRFVLFTNYVRYVDEFVRFAVAALRDPASRFTSLSM